ncbi:hypothetical protein ACFWBS_36445, partial [Streptomyces mirabilis]|uniref:hypothetical protein n=1 Tax=Streptomyces mirabilis TaxID=68239 RepID=UPI00365341A0
MEILLLVKEPRLHRGDRMNTELMRQHARHIPDRIPLEVVGGQPHMNTVSTEISDIGNRRRILPDPPDQFDIDTTAVQITGDGRTRIQHRQNTSCLVHPLRITTRQIDEPDTVHRQRQRRIHRLRLHRTPPAPRTLAVILALPRPRRPGIEEVVGRRRRADAGLP